MSEDLTLNDLLDEFECRLDEVISSMKQVKAPDLGLDHRAGYCFWVDDDNIVVSARSDGVLRYYGGFEYIDDSYRTAVGRYVIYRRDDGRVDECLDNLREDKEQEEE